MAVYLGRSDLGQGFTLKYSSFMVVLVFEDWVKMG
jgi:hypothetical protein